MVSLTLFKEWMGGGEVNIGVRERRGKGKYGWYVKWINNLKKCIVSSLPKILRFQQATTVSYCWLLWHYWMSFIESIPVHSFLERMLDTWTYLHISCCVSLFFIWAPCWEPSECLASFLLYNKEENVPSTIILLRNGDSHRLKFWKVHAMVCAKRQVAMVTFFCGSDGDRGQLSSFVWLILSSLLPGYSTNKKTGGRGCLLPSSLERKQSSSRKRKDKE